jgi:hypothetical protein
MKLYIAGPITGFPEHPEAFDAAKVAIVAHGHEPISPLEIFPGDDWDLAMQADIAALVRVDGIVLLQGWPGSRGARLELLLALELRKRVFVLVAGALVDVSSLPVKAQEPSVCG